MEENQQKSDLGNESKCTGCGAILKYAPGTNHLNCEYCGFENEIKSKNQDEKIEELDFHNHLNEELKNSSSTQQLSCEMYRLWCRINIEA